MHSLLGDVSTIGSIARVKNKTTHLGIEVPQNVFYKAPNCLGVLGRTGPLLAASVSGLGGRRGRNSMSVSSQSESQPDRLRVADVT